ncbi:mechanosensitive ion channel family protein [Halegenticoccus tardaugens]|uniref:mechanosensitive ion channel family protein n=1 Tax=Halegenticoccus tardaugens TaxID=2071624 RepID=UPI00100A442B|nr:mechanosensitive ion channel family protein [Halegenticoccus tardaugens]
MFVSPGQLLDGTVGRFDYGAFLLQLGVFAVTFAVTYGIGRLVAVPIGDRVLQSERITPTVRRPSMKAVRAAVVVVAFFAGLFFARLETLLSVTGGLAAALTLAVGFASRNVIGNLVGGVFIVTDPKFNLGDWIEWEDNEGIIEDISFRATRVRTFRNELITVPNSVLANAVVTNHAIKDRLRIDYAFSVEYGGDIDGMRRVLIEEAKWNPRILADPEPEVMVDDVTAAGIGLTSRFWIENPTRRKYLSVRSAYFQAVKERFEREGFEMSPDYLELTGDLDVSGSTVVDD